MVLVISGKGEKLPNCMGYVLALFNGNYVAERTAPVLSTKSNDWIIAMLTTL